MRLGVVSEPCVKRKKWSGPWDHCAMRQTRPQRVELRGGSYGRLNCWSTSAMAMFRQVSCYERLLERAPNRLDRTPNSQAHYAEGLYNCRGPIEWLCAKPQPSSYKAHAKGSHRCSEYSPRSSDWLRRIYLIEHKKPSASDPILESSRVPCL